jgi:LPS sulfotransferase NodH
MFIRETDVELFKKHILISDNFKRNLLNDVHSNSILSKDEQFLKMDKSEINVNITVFLIFANRSGSNYLAQILNSTGAFNFAGEMFNHHTVDTKIDELGLNNIGSYYEYIKSLNLNGNLCIKASIFQYLLLHFSGALDIYFPNRKLIIVQRDDKIGQSVSHWIASQTKQWTSTQALKSDSNVEFNKNKIITIIASSFLNEKDTRLALSILKMPYLSINYEEFTKYPEFSIRRIFDFCGIDAQTEIDHSKLTLEKQANELNRTYYDNVIEC